MSLFEKMKSTNFNVLKNREYLEESVKEVLGRNYAGLTTINNSDKSAAIIANVRRPISGFQTITIFIHKNSVWANPISDKGKKLTKHIEEKMRDL